MGTVIIREHNDLQRSRTGVSTGLLKGSLVTDELHLPIKTVSTSGTSTESAPMTARTHFVAIEPDSNVRYVVRPKRAMYTPITCTDQHTPIPAGSVQIEAVYPGAVIAFLQTSDVGGDLVPFDQNLIPVLML